MPGESEGSRTAASSGDVSAAPARLDRQAVAEALAEIGALLRLAGESGYRARAYERAADTLALANIDLPRLVDGRGLRDLPGVGSRLAEVISELHMTGRARILEELRRDFPAGAGALSRLAGLGVDRIAALSTAGIRTIAELQAACESGQLRGVKGIGERTERRILAAIQRLSERRVPAVLLPEALDLGERLVARASGAPGVRACELAGGLRRWTETMEDLVMVVASDRPAAAVEHILAGPGMGAVSRRGRDGGDVTLANGLPLAIRAVPTGSYPIELLSATGAAGHVDQLEELAAERGIAIRPSGLWRGKQRLPVETEGDVYRHLGLPLVPPELR